MAEAKDALIGFAVANPVRGFLPCPADPALAGTPTEGTALATCSSDALHIGRLPWRTLGIADVRDGDGESLWYAVSGNFTNDAAFINSDASPPTLSVNGTTSYAAIIFSPGGAIGVQQRGATVAACATTGTPLRLDSCATNYLDIDPTSGISNADADTTFAQTNGNQFNDLLLPISADQFLGAVGKLVLQQVRACLVRYASNASNPNGLYPWAHQMAGPLGSYDAMSLYSDDPAVTIGRIPDQVFNSVTVPGVPPAAPLPLSWIGADCPLPCPAVFPGVSCATSRRNWLKDWHELVFYAVSPQYAPGGAGGGIPGSFMVNGTSNVRAVVMLAGATLSGQTRSSPGARDTFSNYLESSNASGPTFGITPPPNNDQVLIVAP